MVNIYKTKQNRMEWDGLFELQIQHLPLIYSLKSSHILCPLFYFFLIKLFYDIFLFVGFFCSSLFFPNRHNPLLPQILCVNDYKNTYLKKKKKKCYNPLAKLNSFRAWVMSPGLRGSMHIYRITWTEPTSYFPKQLQCAERIVIFFFPSDFHKNKGLIPPAGKFCKITLQSASTKPANTTQAQTSPILAL